MRSRPGASGRGELNLPAVPDLGDRPGRLPELPPLRRKPKTLTSKPDLFGAGSTSVRLDKVEGKVNAADLDGFLGAPTSALSRRTSSERGLTELLEDDYVDSAVATLAKGLARRMSIARRRRPDDRDRTAGRRTTVPYRPGSGEIDVDQTLDVLVEGRPLVERDIVVWERQGPKRAMVLVVDVSGSMRGEKTLMTAAAVGAISAECNKRHENFGVVAFWSDAALLKPLSASVGPEVVLDRLLRIPARGLTNINFALEVAYAELARSSVLRRDAILLTDAMHNAGDDPRLAARKFPRLQVLLETDGEHDEVLGRELARLGRGGLVSVASHHAVGGALSRLLGD